MAGKKNNTSNKKTKQTKAQTAAKNSKKTVVEEPVQESVPAPAPKTAAPKAKGGKKAKQQSAPAPEPVVVTETTEAASTETEKKGNRSFKVMLPGYEAYDGRYTGKTPYQAANKALSKYFREAENADENIQFSIKESTRGSAKRVYHYTGERMELETPVEYTITDKTGTDKTITKNFKNRLKKIKKNELGEMLVAQASESS